MIATGAAGGVDEETFLRQRGRYRVDEGLFVVHPQGARLDIVFHDSRNLHRDESKTPQQE